MVEERAGELRKQAERILSKKPQAIRNLAPVDIKKLIHELNVYQIELEMQNEELLRIQLELQSARDKYLNLYDFAPTGYFTLDTNGLIVDANITGSELMGSEKHRLIGAQFTRFISPDSQDAFYFHRREVLKTGAKGRCELKMLKEDGTPFHAQLISAVISEEDENINHCRTAVIDISEQKKAEEERRELEKRVQMVDRLASIGEMASGIAHEINNPLTSVIGYSQLLLERDIPEDIGEDVGIIANGAQRVADIVTRLLTFAYQYQPVKSSNDINRIIEVVLKLRGYELETGNIEVITRLDPELPWVICDAGQLQQVFMNIITNAETEMRKAHDRGKLIIKTERIGDSIRISFADDGPGIARENVSKIFDPFFTTREVGEGAGLGLSVSHGIITEHGGQIYAESELGKGTALFVELPIITEQELPQAIEEAEEEGVKKALPARILVVDDEPSILTYMDKLLTAQGHQVETVNNPIYGLKKIKENRYRLILTDIKMPGMSGIELYNSIREISPSLTGRVVFITGDMISADTRRFLTESGVPYITKPFDTKKLKDEINRILSENS